uniref:small monomeric GTPase n=1 Tax=Xiphophorus couchianus TaxID=32473 RepID=A0A3B5LVD8_9TELE
MQRPTSVSGCYPVCHFNEKTQNLTKYFSLIVRFLTKRFIGDYEANTGALYSRKVTMDGEEVSLQIQDTPCVALQVNLSEANYLSIYWADGYVLVFSITDNSSYRTIQPLYQHIRRIHPSGNIPVILVGNKSDLLRARQVPAEEGDTLATSLGVAFSRFHQKGGLHLARPKSPNMQELKRRFRQVLSSKVKSATTI